MLSAIKSSFANFQKITLTLALIGLAAFWIMFFNIGNVYMPVLERLSVYTLVVWSFIAGVYIIKK